MDMTVDLGVSLVIVAADAIVLTIIWIKTFRHVKEASRLGISVGISTTLLRDGESL